MSWSVNAMGNPKAVAEKLAKDFANIKCSEPEESIKSSVSIAVAAALAAFPPNMAVQVEANGSQWAPDSSKPDEKQNSLSVKINPLGAFLS